LAMLYLRGSGVKKCLEEAFLWFMKAAGQGVIAAQSRLGVMYASGAGVAHDPIEAHKWFLLASTGKDKSALANCEKSRGELNADQIVEASRRTACWAARLD
jgi:TPR repeat protein